MDTNGGPVTGDVILPMATREVLLKASDLVEKVVALESIGVCVKIRSLPAAYSNQAQSEALEMVSVMVRGRQQQTAHINTHKLEALQVLHALVEPKLNSIADVEQFAKMTGPAWRTLVEAIDEISGIDKDAIEEANARFRSGVPGESWGAGTDAPGAGNGESHVPAPIGA